MAPNSLISTSELPLEVVEDVLGHLCDDKPSLLSCAVVNQTFSVASRLHLFRSVSLNVHRKPGVLHEFRCWLRAAPRVPCFIRSLSVGEQMQTFDAKPAQIDFGEVLGLLEMLPSVAVLRLFNVYWTTIGIEESNKLETFAINFPSIQELECNLAFRQKHSESTYAFDLIGRMPSLKEITISGGMWRSAQQLPIVSLPCLHHLKLDFIGSVNVLQTFRRSTMSRLKTLSVATGPLSDVVQLIAFTSTLSSLVDLSVRMGYHDCLCESRTM